MTLTERRSDRRVSFHIQSRRMTVLLLYIAQTFGHFALRSMPRLSSSGGGWMPGTPTMDEDASRLVHLPLKTKVAEV